jgi:uncharacterized membrane protein
MNPETKDRIVQQVIPALVITTIGLGGFLTIVGVAGDKLSIADAASKGFSLGLILSVFTACLVMLKNYIFYGSIWSTHSTSNDEYSN